MLPVEQPRGPHVRPAGPGGPPGSGGGGPRSGGGGASCGAGGPGGDGPMPQRRMNAMKPSNAVVSTKDFMSPKMGK